MRLELEKYQWLVVSPPNLQRGEHAENRIEDRPSEAEIRKDGKKNYHIFHQLRSSD